MTNEYDTESHPQPQDHEHEEPAAGQETPAHEGEPGVWTDDQPPHDDFGSANEETATVSQEAATEGEVEETATPEARQSRSMLPILAGIGGIILLGGVIYLQYGRSSPPAPPLHLVTSSPAQQKAAEDASSPAQQAIAPAGNATAAEIDALYKPAGTPSPVVMPPSSTPVETTPAPMPTSLPPMPSTPTTSATETAPKSASNAAVNIPAQPQGNPSNPPPPMPNNVLHPSASAELPNIATPGTANRGMMNEEQQQVVRLNALSSRMDTLQKSLDQVTNMVAAVPSETAHSNTDMENRLNRIEQTLMKLESDQATKKPSSSSIAAAASETAEETPHATHAAKTTSRHRHAHTKTTSTHHRKPSSMEAETAGARSSSWVLRAATPKEAWVSADPSSPDLRHVQIGDSLAGIGVVRSIRQANGGWEIEGSSGIIR